MKRVLSVCAGVWLALSIADAGVHLDPSFGDDGRVVTSFPGNGNDFANGVAVQSDQKIVVAGTSNKDFALARYNPDGTLDPSFGTGGLVTTNFARFGDEYGNALVLQPDGKIIVAGYAVTPVPPGGPTDPYPFFAIVRYNIDGSLDASFDGDGMAFVSFGTPFVSASAVALQADGKVVVAGTTGRELALMRLNGDGTLDGGFGNGGRVTIDLGGAFMPLIGLIVQPDGKIVLATQGLGGNGRSDFALVRYNADGALDISGFGNGGIVLTDFSGRDDLARAILLQPDGKLIAAGRSEDAAGNYNFALARYEINGTLDPSFGNGGKVTTDFGAFDDLRSVALLPDGRIVAAGSFSANGRPPNLFALAFYEPTGTPDFSAGAGGKVTSDFYGVDNIAQAVSVDAAGKIIVAGFTQTGGASDYEFALARYVVPLGAQLANISTRGFVGAGDQFLIGGFILEGNQPRRILLRGLGPSLQVNGTPIAGRLTNPTLRLMARDSELELNDSWRTNQSAVQATGLAPENDAEAAMVRTLGPGAYTAILSGEGGATGVGLIEIYDADSAGGSRLANISTRGFVRTGEQVLIGGLIVGASNNESSNLKIQSAAGPLDETARVIVRAIGPSLRINGVPVPGRLSDTMLTLQDGNGNVIAANDNWKSTQESEIEATGLAPSDDLEAAIVTALPRGNYTAIMRGAGETSGIGLLEIFHLPIAPATKGLPNE